VGELRPCSDLVDERVRLWSKPGLLLVRRLLAPPPLVQLAPTVNEFKYAGQPFMRESIVHGGDRIAGYDGVGICTDLRR
jgi:hypothetical protein